MRVLTMPGQNGRIRRSPATPTPSTRYRWYPDSDRETLLSTRRQSSAAQAGGGDDISLPEDEGWPGNISIGPLRSSVSMLATGLDIEYPLRLAVQAVNRTSFGRG